ncbi:uncharacterized protein KY384_008394 [Bacidia gigantensis]|uniref:uncharacterized protein n=1 Tax=Bacidia gigantensis TaxID=2732470 RepID=UPI001D03BD02|nr:uncharacterized protein KY384_008394 [Bacidia gigantensis]KAG8526965.1 hypothetical protein KY384_008394 [Bacidia gigantensis]
MLREHKAEQDMFDLDSIQESFNAVTESIEEQFDSIARLARDTYRSTPWIPESMKPDVPPPPPPFYETILPPAGYLQACRIWISEHRAVTAAVVAFVGTGAFIVWRQRRADRKKRRAKRARNGQKTEVVLLAGSLHSPFTRSLSLDLERRGFIVYIPAASVSEEQIINVEANPDIRPLSLDITSPSSVSEAVSKFEYFLDSPLRTRTASTASKPHLAACLLLPPPVYPVRGIASLEIHDWSHTLNLHILAPFGLVHAFLPLLINQNSNLSFLTSSINSSLRTPSHAPEGVVVGGIEQYIASLRREMPSINVVQMKLGHFDLSQFSPENKQLVIPHELSRVNATKARLGVKPYGGSALRELHNNVFDVIVRSKGRNSTVFVGRGSRVYDIVGKWVPSGLVGWILGANQSWPSMFAQSKSKDLKKGQSEEPAAEDLVESMASIDDIGNEA